MSITPLSDGAVPPNYKEVLYWKLTEKGRAVIMNLLALPLALVFVFISFGLVFLVGQPLNLEAYESQPGTFVIPITIGPVIAVIIGSLISLPVHEAAHGIAMRIYGARPQFGLSLKNMVAYATAPGYAFRRSQYLVIILAPLVVLSLLAYLGILLLAGTPAVWFLAACATLNGGSASGDLWMSTIILRYPVSAYFVDERDGMRVFLPDKDDAIV